MTKDVGVIVPYQVLATFGHNVIRGNGKDEVRYNCPECLKRRGKPDLDGKLYVNVKSLKFHCFKCGYAGVISKEAVSDQKYYHETVDSSLKEIADEVNSIDNKSTDFSLKIPRESVLSNKNAVRYLLKRGFTKQQMEYYDMRSGNLNQEFGRIVIPNEVDHRVYTDFYSARTYIDQIPKYHNPGKQKSKIVFNLFRQKEGEPIIIVEGALTAVAAGYHAVATLGKTMTKYQASAIAKKKPSKIYVNYDYGAEQNSHDACKVLKSVLPETPIYEVFMPDERDAADLSRDEYVERLNSAKLYNPVISDILSLI